jgi:mannosyltransferase
MAVTDSPVRSTGPARGTVRGGDVPSGSTPNIAARAVSALTRGARRPVPWGLAAALGLLAALVSFAGSWIPSLWGDEAASILSAQRSFGSLANMLTTVDAVHGTYYALLHLWIDAFGASPVSVRLPSAIAVGLAAAGVVVLADRLAGRRIAIIAALLFAVLPRTTYMGAEARSYALGTACAVWLTVLLVHLVVTRSRSRLAWAGFALGFAASIYVFLYLVLLAPVYAATLVVLARDRGVALRWLMASGIGVLLAAPLIVFAVRQRHQIAFLSHRPGVTPFRFLVQQWFGADPLAIVAWALILVLLIAVAVARTRPGRGIRRALKTWAGGPSGALMRSPLVVLALAWFVLPPLILFVANLFAPLYTIRYMSFVTPAVAMLLALALDVLCRRRVVLVAGAVLALAALAAPSYLHERSPHGKDGGSDWAQVAQTIGANARPGDAIAFDETTRPSRRPRLAMRLYPHDFRDVIDVTLQTPYFATSGLWDRTRSITASATQIEATDGRLWLIEYRGPNGSGVVSSVGEHQRLAELSALGYRVDRTFTLHRDDVLLLTKGSAT